MRSNQAVAVARESSDFQTSGHNTPRLSVETLDSDVSGVSGEAGIDERSLASLV